MNSTSRFDATLRRPVRALPRKLPKRKRPIPRAAYRRAHSPRPPHGVELYMLAALTRMAQRFARAVWTVVEPEIASFAMPDPEERADAKPPKRPKKPRDRATEVRDKAKKAADDALNPKALSASATEAGKRAVQHSKKEFERLGIKVAKEPLMTPLIDGWRKDTVARITAMQDDQLDKIEDILRDGFGHRHETLAKEIRRQVDGVTQSRAELIARDQVLTLNAKITRHRQTAAGIERYIWTTSNDERVREEHAALEDKKFSWDEGGDPEEGHPGEAVNCRCVAFPVLPELDDEDTGDEGGDDTSSGSGEDASASDDEETEGDE